MLIEQFMIKNYLDLNQTEITALLDFINRNEAQKTILEQFRKQYVNENFDFGKGIFIIFDGGTIVAKSLLLNRSLKLESLQLNKLEENNKLEYIDIHKEAFSDVPNIAISLK